MRQLVGIVFILLIAVAPSCNFFKERKLFGKKAKSLAALRAQQDSIRVADSIRNVQEQMLAHDRARLDSVKLAEERLVTSTNKYNIIVGSFITPEYAKSLSATYRQQGYDTQILKMEGSKFELVSAESHERLGKAITRLKQFQDTVELDAWIYIKR